MAGLFDGDDRSDADRLVLRLCRRALRKGWRPDDSIANGPIETGTYRPKNASGTYSPSITLEDAFATSSNVAAVRLLQEVGDDRVIAMARDLGVTAPLAKGDPSLALGTSTMTLMSWGGFLPIGIASMRMGYGPLGNL